MELEAKQFKRIIESCPDCDGSGIIPVQTSQGVRLEDCKCVQKVSKLISYDKAGIPQKYVNWDMRNIQTLCKSCNKIKTRQDHKIIAVERHKEKLRSIGQTSIGEVQNS